MKKSTLATILGLTLALSTATVMATETITVEKNSSGGVTVTKSRETQAADCDHNVTCEAGGPTVYCRAPRNSSTTNSGGTVLCVSADKSPENCYDTTQGICMKIQRYCAQHKYDSSTGTCVAN